MRRRGSRAAWLAAASLWAISGAQAASSPPTVSTSAALLNALLGLAVVLALLYGFFWLLRRYGPSRVVAQGAVKVVGGVMLGTRERLVVVEVRDTWLLLGVAGGGVNLLHSMAKPEAGVDDSPPERPQFAAKLAELLARQGKAGR